MSATVEFYSAEPEKIRSIFELEDFDQWYEAKNSLPVADFSIHLNYPDDLDGLMDALRQQGFRVPRNFTELLMETIWDDGEDTAKLQKVDPVLQSLATANDQTIETIAQKWVGNLENLNVALHAVQRLRDVCRNADEHRQSVVLYTCY